MSLHIHGPTGCFYRTVMAVLAAGVLIASESWNPAYQPIFPTTRVRPADPIQVSAVDAQIRIRDQVAVTTLTLRLSNRSAMRQEAVVCLPLTPGAQVIRVDLGGGSTGLPGVVLPVAEARRIYAEIVAKVRDPALVEFAGTNLLKSSVFPIEPGQTQSVAIAWEETLATVGGRVDYVLPRSELLAYKTPWTVTADISTSGGGGGLGVGGELGAVFAPGQPLAEQRLSSDRVVVKIGGSAPPLAAGPVRLSWLNPRQQATVFATLDPDGKSGTFMVVAPAPPAQGKSMPRDVSVVIDRSGSMAGDKWRQTVAAVTQIMNSLGDDERLDLMIFNEGVDRFRPGPEMVTAALRREAEAWMAAMRPMGGTNIHAAISAALTPAVIPGRMPVVLLLTDGVPTIGVTREEQINALVSNDLGKRRVFTVGIGSEVNAPLLDSLAALTRGRHRPIFLTAGDNGAARNCDVEIAVAEIMTTMGRPVLIAPTFSWTGGAVMDVQPPVLPDRCAGETIMVFGRYVMPQGWKAGPPVLNLHVRGMGADGREVIISTLFDVTTASPEHAFVARLWAGRRIGECLRLIRATDVSPEQRAELVKTVVDLSTTYGILTECTAFLASEPGPITTWRDHDHGERMKKAAQLAADGYFEQRYGVTALAYSSNNQRLEQANTLAAIANGAYVDAAYRASPAVQGVQPCGNSAMWQQGKTWVEAGIAMTTPSRTIAFASTEYFALVERLTRSNRQRLLTQSGELLIRDGADVVLITADRAN